MNAKAVIFYCNWSAYPGFQFAQSLLKKPEFEQKLLVSMCSGRISPELILEAFYKGAWGVMVTACPPDKCEHNGNYKTVARVALLKKMLDQFGLNPDRLKLEWIDKGEAVKLKGAIDTFMGEIKRIGPSD